MLSSGNSAVPVCVLNLLRTIRGEVPYVRTKGIDRALIDIPESQSSRVLADAEWVIDSYEPRADLDDVISGGTLDGAEAGDVSILAKLK